MSEHEDERVDEILKRAAPEPRPELRVRTLSALVEARPREARPRPLVTALGVALVLFAVAFVPYSANDSQARTAMALAAATAKAGQEDTGGDEEQTPEQLALAPYRERAAAFVESKYPRDAAMLMAAGLLTKDDAVALPLLRRAAEQGRDPLAWRSYAIRLLEAMPGFERVACWGGDPTDPRVLEDWRRAQRESHLPERLTQAQAAPVLAALGRWQAVEPNGALAAMLISYVRYGLHQDREALAVWVEAGRKTQVGDHAWESLAAVVDLLARMGMPEDEALSSGLYGWGGELYARLRTLARIAQYEGRVAQIEGRPRDAIAWWNATIAIGRTLQENSSTIIGAMVGIAVEGIGAWPTWRWAPDRVSGGPGGPLLGGREIYGPEHAFYVRQVGAAADAEVRDHLIQGKVRSTLMREYSQATTMRHPTVRAKLLLGLAAMATVPLLLLALVYAASSLRTRASADAATALSPGWRLVLACATVLPLVLGDAVAWQHLGRAEATTGGVLTTAGSVMALGGGALLTLVLTLVLPLLAGRWSRTPGARLRATWRGNLRRVAPVGVLLCALLAIGLALSGRYVRGRWLQEWHSPNHSEMTAVRDYFGSRWTNPPLPKDAWRAEYPPQQPQGQALPAPSARGGHRGRGGGGGLHGRALGRGRGGALAGRRGPL